MASKIVDVERYAYNYNTKNSNPAPNVLASIRCYKKDDIVAYINFYEDGMTPDSGLMKDHPSIVVANFDISRFNDVICTLRYEKPICVVYQHDYKYAYISTSAEPIGEQEGN